MISEWNVVEILIAIVGFIGGFAAGSWKLSQYITKNTVVVETNNAKLTSIEDKLNKLTEERYAERERVQNQFSTHETRITQVENHITLLYKRIEEIKEKKQE